MWKEIKAIVGAPRGKVLQWKDGSCLSKPTTLCGTYVEVPVSVLVAPEKKNKRMGLIVGRDVSGRKELPFFHCQGCGGYSVNSTIRSLLYCITVPYPFEGH
jgi:hypothetical protein